MSAHTNPLTLEPTAHEVDLTAHALGKTARYCLGVGGRLTLTRPVSDREDEVLSFRHAQLDAATALLPASTVVKVHVSAAAPRTARAQLQRLAARGWALTGVAWNNESHLGRDAYLVFRTPG